MPFEPLIAVLEDSVRWQMRGYNKGDQRVYFDRQIGQVLGWFIRHRPKRVQGLFGAIVGDVERGMKIPRAVTMESLRGSIEFDGGFDDDDHLREFLDRALPPQH